MAPTPSVAHGSSARRRVLAASAAGAAVGAAVTAVSPTAAVAPLVGWIAAAASFVAWTWFEVWPRDADATAAHVGRDDPSRRMADLACLTAAMASLVAVGVLLLGASSAHGTTKLLEVSLCLGSVVAAWAVVHTVFALRYARTYFATGERCISFNDDERPRYSDFAYVAVTIGLTFQVSDTDLRSNLVRRLAIKHMLLSYLMGAVFIAISINLVAGMAK